MELEQRVLSARENCREIDSLLSDYLPLIKKEVLGLTQRGADFEDMLSIGMLAFVNAIHRYEPGRGSFVTFAKVNIRNRVIDELRRDSGKGKVVAVAFQANDGELPARSVENSASIAAYSREREREALAEEIRLLSSELVGYGITFDQLPSICPKQGRSRGQCLELARTVAQDADLRQAFLESRRIPQSALAARHKLSVKTVEKHRKYIVTLILLLLGDYSGIRTFLPQYKEVR